MAATFTADGVTFQYPETWSLQRENSANGWTVSLQSPETAFFLVSLDSDMPETEAMADTALAALQEEYPTLEAVDRIDSVAGLPAIGYDIRFFSLDLTNTGWLRSVYGGRGTILLLWQANDLELERVGPVLQQICTSLRIDADDEPE
ncbi:MAG: hypothetical protein NZO58_12275 [Gemmataceae bacterium]|nr:hypothetical protein [Gemmataceae bacterium]